jgi:hypothetical protein
LQEYFELDYKTSYPLNSVNKTSEEKGKDHVIEEAVASLLSYVGARGELDIRNPNRKKGVIPKKKLEDLLLQFPQSKKENP